MRVELIPYQIITLSSDGGSSTLQAPLTWIHPNQIALDVSKYKSAIVRVRLETSASTGVSIGKSVFFLMYSSLDKSTFEPILESRLAFTLASSGGGAGAVIEFEKEGQVFEFSLSGVDFVKPSLSTVDGVNPSGDFQGSFSAYAEIWLK